MKEHQVNSFSKLHKVLGRYRKNTAWLFRGHSNPEWELKPKAGRDGFDGCNDEISFRAWKRRAYEFISLPFDNDWAWLAVAQHHGLATRLLDWTFNPLAAAFFAVGDTANSEAVIFAYNCSSQIVPEEVKPFEFKGVGKFKPMGVAPRIIRQGGIFTIHSEPNLLLDDAMNEADELERIVIDRTYRDDLLFELSHYNVTKATLFPDLDGLSAYMNWFVINRQYWSGTVELEDEV